MKVFLLTCLIASIIVLALAKCIIEEGLTHHLAVLKLCFEHGGMHEIAYMAFTYRQMNLELHYLIPLWLGKDTIPKFNHLDFVLLSVWILCNYLISRKNPTYAQRETNSWLIFPEIC